MKKAAFVIILIFSYFVFSAAIAVPIYLGRFENLAPQIIVWFHAYFAPQYAIIITQLSDAESTAIIRPEIYLKTFGWLVLYFALPTLLFYFEDEIYRQKEMKAIVYIFTYSMQITFLAVELLFGWIFYKLLIRI